tara:strand:+ start:258 stop:674 length:417 start_codon:yes stop_codon:yes gene_type:complete
MEIKVNKYIYFGSLVKKLKSKKGGFDFEGELAKKIARASRKLITSGNNNFAPLSPHTLRQRKGDGPILLDQGNLVKSIRATKKGVTYIEYGGHHRTGTAHMPQREFIAWYADEGEKNKIISNIKRDLSKLLKENLRKK